MAATLVRNGKTIAAFLRWIFIGIKALIDKDTSVALNCAEDVSIAVQRPGNIVPNVHIIELNAQLEVLLENIFDGDGGLDDHIARMGKPSEQRLRIAFYGLFGQKENFPGYQCFILICISRPCRPSLVLQFSASWAKRATSSIVMPLVVRNKAASSRGVSRMISDRSVETLPARARSSSTSISKISAILRTLFSAGGGNSSRSTFER